MGLSADRYQSYEISRPLSTHWRKATCEQIECPGWTQGYEVVVDERTDLGQRQAAYLRDQLPIRSGRPVAKQYQDDMLMTHFVFAPGTECMRAGEHRTSNDRPPNFLKLIGDRQHGVSGVLVRHSGADSFVDDMSTHLEKISGQIEG